MTAPAAAGGWSLRARLTGLIVLLALLAWTTGSLWLYRVAVAESNRLFDAALIETAHAVLAVADHELRRQGRHREIGDDFDAGRNRIPGTAGRAGDRDDDDGAARRRLELARVDHAHEEQLFYQVRGPDGAIVYRSPGAPQDALAAAGASGFVQAQADGRAYRVYALRADGRAHDGPAAGRSAIHVAQREDDRVRLARAAGLRLLLPGVALALLLALATPLIVRRVTAPVVRYAQALDALHPGDAAARAPEPAGLPRELQSIGTAVEQLLARVREALRQERTLTADAAHELRTPLAALRAQAQVAARSHNDAERAAALQALQAGVDRATGLVGAMLTLARLDAATFDAARLPVVDPAAIAAAVAADLQSTARTRGVRLDLQLAQCRLRADADALAVLLRNLLDNALRHARSRVLLTVAAAGGRVQLAVGDDGPGLDNAQAARVFDRFYRGPGSADDGSGNGLGLAIVRRVAELHGGRVQVQRSALGGAQFEAQLPCEPAAGAVGAAPER